MASPVQEETPQQAVAYLVTETRIDDLWELLQPVDRQLKDRILRELNQAVNAMEAEQRRRCTRLLRIVLDNLEVAAVQVRPGRQVPRPKGNGVKYDQRHRLRRRHLVPRSSAA